MNMYSHHKISSKEVTGGTYVVLLLILPVAMASAGVGWRGDGTSVFPSATPPTSWSQTENVIWKTELPKKSHSTPVLGKDRIFLTGEPDQALCFDKATGKLLWTTSCGYTDVLPPAEAEIARKEVKRSAKLSSDIRDLKVQIVRMGNKARKSKDPAQKAELVKQIAEKKAALPALEQEVADMKYPYPFTHKGNGYASATPYLDGDHIYYHFGFGVLAKLDLNGKILWAKLVEKSVMGYGHSSSPVVVDGVVVTQVKNITGYDGATGQELWKVDSELVCGSPVVMDSGGKKIVITPTGIVIDPKTGTVLSRDLPCLHYNSPTVKGDVVYFIDTGKNLGAFKVEAEDRAAGPRQQSPPGSFPSPTAMMSAARFAIRPRCAGCSASSPAGAGA